MYIKSLHQFKDGDGSEFGNGYKSGNSNGNLIKTKQCRELPGP